MQLELFYLVLALATFFAFARFKQKYATPKPLEEVQIKTSINSSDTIKNEEIFMPYEKSIDLPKVPEIAPSSIKPSQIANELYVTEKDPTLFSEPVYTIKRIKREAHPNSKDTLRKASIPTPEKNKENTLSSFLLQETEKCLTSLGSVSPPINTSKIMLNPSASPFTL